MGDPRHRTILECAARLFMRHGPHKTTMADIAREARIGVGTVYLVFPSKESIVQELSSSAHMRVLTAMREIATQRAVDGLVACLGGVLEARTHAFLQLATEGRHACELLQCEAVQPVHGRFRHEERALFAEIFERAKAAHELGEHDCSESAALVQRAFASLSPPWLFQQPATVAREQSAALSQLLMLGLLTRGVGKGESPK